MSVRSVYLSCYGQLYATIQQQIVKLLRTISSCIVLNNNIINTQSMLCTKNQMGCYYCKCVNRQKWNQNTCNWRRIIFYETYNENSSKVHVFRSPSLVLWSVFINHTWDYKKLISSYSNGIWDYLDYLIAIPTGSISKPHYAVYTSIYF